MKTNDIYKTRSAIFFPALVLLVNVFFPPTNLTAEDNPVSGETQQNSDENSSDEETYQLVYKFEPNQVLKYTVNHLTEVDTHKGDFSELNKNESITEMHYRVVSVDSSQHAILEPVLDHVQMTAKFANADPITYDSEKSEEIPPQFSGVDESIGKGLSRYKFDPKGKLLEILDLRKADQINPVPNPEHKTESLLANHNFLVVFPEHPVKIGEKWKDQYEVLLKVSETATTNAQFLRKYELESVEGDLATISLKTVLISAVQDPRERLQLIQKAPTGKVVFDIKKGIVVSRELDIDQTEFGIFGDNSKIHVTSKRIEKQVH